MTTTNTQKSTRLLCATSVRFNPIVWIIAALFCIFVVLTCCVTTAHAAGGVQCTGFMFQGPQSADSASPEPGAAYYLCVEFDKNVSYALDPDNASFVEENLSKVHLRKDDGTDVASAWTQPAHDKADRQLIYVWIDEWLDPLTTYKVEVDEGIQAANGEDVTSQPYSFSFTTNDRCENGLSIFENAGIPVVIAVLVIGAGVMVARVVRRGRR